MIRAVVDVNVVVSAVIGPLGHSRRILLSWEQGLFTSVTSEGIVTEVEAKLRLSRITEDDARWLFGLLLTQAQPLIAPLWER
jgi:predicted nucleic acid-binding protein